MREQIMATGRFFERPQQKNGTICFSMEGRRGASIYVMPNREFAIRVQAFDNQFPNSHRLHDYVSLHWHRMEGHRNNQRYAYALHEQHIVPVLRIITS